MVEAEVQILSCSTCKQDKDASFFTVRKGRPRGFHYSCKSCLAEKATKYRELKIYTIEERVAAKERSRVWRECNPERNKKIKKDWAKLNQEKKNAASSRRRCQKLNATPAWITETQLKEIEDLFWLAKDLKSVSGEEYHVDHIIPLQGKNVCGLHVPWNLQILHRFENLSKGNKTYEKSR